MILLRPGSAEFFRFFSCLKIVTLAMGLGRGGLLVIYLQHFTGDFSPSVLPIPPPPPCQGRITLPLNWTRQEKEKAGEREKTWVFSKKNLRVHRSIYLTPTVGWVNFDFSAKFDKLHSLKLTRTIFTHKKQVLWAFLSVVSGTMNSWVLFAPPPPHPPVTLFFPVI